MRIAIAAVALALASTTAFAFHCPADMKRNDAHLATGPGLAAERTSRVEELRAAGEPLHNDGMHHASVAVLAEAMQVSGIR